MNSLQLVGKWHKLKGRVKSTWGRLSADINKTIGGAVEKQYGVIQEGLSYAKAALKKNAPSFQIDERKRS